MTPQINQCVSFRLRTFGAKRRFPILAKIPILNPSNIRNYGMSGMRKIKIGFVISIVVLFLGWLPKVGAGRVSWYLDNDFAHYYLTGGLVRSGINPYAVNLSPLYAGGGFTPTRDVPQGGASPTLAVIMAPVSALPPFEAFCVWTAAQVVSLFLGVVLLLRVCEVECSRRAVIFLLLAWCWCCDRVGSGGAQACFCGASPLRSSSLPRRSVGSPLGIVVGKGLGGSRLDLRPYGVFLFGCVDGIVS